MVCTPHLYYSGDQIEKNEKSGVGRTYGGGNCRVLVGKPERKRSLGRPRLRREDNSLIDLQEVGWGAWTGLNWLKIGKGGGHL